MTEAVVPADILINKDVAKKAVKDAFDLETHSIEILGEGWDNIVFLVNRQFAFRFPRRTVATPLLKREIQILSKIAATLELKVPNPTYVSKGTPAFSHIFYGHKLISGRTGCGVSLTTEEFNLAATKLGTFLKRLHQLDPKTLISESDALVPAYDRADPKRMFGTFNDRYQSIRKIIDLKHFEAKIKLILSKAREFTPNRAKQSFVHGDLYNRHLLFDGQNQLTGIIDWGDSCVSDPVVDLSVLYQFFPESSHTHFWQAYQSEPSQERKGYARFLGLYYAVALLWYGHDRKDKILTDSSLKTLKDI